MTWQIYDDLIAAVPEDLEVQDCMIGHNWIAVRSAGIGIAMKPPEAGAMKQRSGSVRGMKVKDLAQWSKSWDFMEAAIGIAAINSAFNTAPCVAPLAGRPLAEMPSEDLFHHLAPGMKGKKVAVIGHFYNIEWLAESCCLSILERRPRAGDLPDPACEYILGEQDFVIMTATTLINKTMPRLLELSHNAQVVVCGPTTPLHPVMFGHGIDLLGGLVIEDEKIAWQAVQEGVERGLMGSGSRMIQLPRPTPRQHP